MICQKATVQWWQSGHDSIPRLVVRGIISITNTMNHVCKRPVRVRGAFGWVWARMGWKLPLLKNFIHSFSRFYYESIAPYVASVKHINAHTIIPKRLL